MELRLRSNAGAGSLGTERIAAFSDGVIAIIITIMVLELKLPEAAAKDEVWSGFLAPLAPKLAIYALSFGIVAPCGSIITSCWPSCAAPHRS